MIKGIGVDVCAIRRMEDLLPNARFMQRVFTDRERLYFESRGVMAAASAAACYAAKEAFSKALGTGIGPVAFSEIEITHTKDGGPQYVLSGRAAQVAAQKGITRYHLSLSHEKDTAIAMAVLEEVP
ncbi:MAG: holo-ACP synthase [Eubacteriales bacterium]|jgi:holo-[acyl-carrier protein] synthase|nr:holo-ACP synthase [Eubacteriales bacterium]MDD4104292.1 holo-ACP synthase [Eubacteriales bacterium]MDD4709761.1 holo-ACP synthase [Eubacteriales bacterium]NLO14700.1 holo-ACP synthase [Clostridiales bacterium]